MTILYIYMCCTSFECIIYACNLWNFKEELRETHKDYREELANLAHQVSEKKKEAANKPDLSLEVIVRESF